MKSLLSASTIVVAVLVSAQVGVTDVVAGQNWADDVEDHSSAIQNYGGTVMDESTTWWLTGPPDATETDDYVGGWRSTTPDEYIIMHWETPLADRSGDDLVIRMYSGPDASADVLASVDGSAYTGIGTLGGGTPSIFREESFDFDEQFADDISYVKVQRLTSGPQTGMFFDAFGGTIAPERIPGDANLDNKVDEADARTLAQYWGQGGATWAKGDFDDDDWVGPGDASILAAHWGYGTDEMASAIPEPSTMGWFAPVLLLLLQRRR